MDEARKRYLKTGDIAEHLGDGDKSPTEPEPEPDLTEPSGDTSDLLPSASSQKEDDEMKPIGKLVSDNP